MCDVHWTLVSAALRDSIAATSESNTTQDASAVAQYRKYVAAAIADVAHREARQQPRRPRPAQKPVQLTLFTIGATS